MKKVFDLKYISSKDLSALYIDNRLSHSDVTESFLSMKYFLDKELECIDINETFEFVISEYVIDDNWLKYKATRYPLNFNKIPTKWIKIVAR